jgi:response regulator RpfG family c-di-GMP phosphodiesterase
MDSERYSAYQHRHNFAVWAAARATQREFTTTEKLREALEASSIDTFVERPCGREDFDGRHRGWCGSICQQLRSRRVEGASYGRAAKLVNVYLKSMVVLPDLSSDVASYVHPPIDRILLQNVAKAPEVSTERSQTLRNTSWTQLSEAAYFELISMLRDINGDRPFWKIEEHWDVTPNPS